MVIYYFKVSIFFIKEVVTLSYIYDPLYETEHPDIEGFFDNEVDHKDNPNTNMCNNPQFRSIYTLISQPAPVGNK